jgi:hypothetical protein
MKDCNEVWGKLRDGGKGRDIIKVMSEGKGMRNVRVNWSI